MVEWRSSVSAGSGGDSVDTATRDKGTYSYSLSSTESDVLHVMSMHTVTRTWYTLLATRPGNCSVVRTAVKRGELGVVGVAVREPGSWSTEMVWLRMW